MEEWRYHHHHHHYHRHNHCHNHHHHHHNHHRFGRKLRMEEAASSAENSRLASAPINPD